MNCVRLQSTYVGSCKDHWQRHLHKVSAMRLLLVIDEAQVLTSLARSIRERTGGEKRPVLHPFCRATNQFESQLTWWISGTSLSLKDAYKVSSSMALKPVASSSVGFVCELPNVFDDYEDFKRFVIEYLAGAVALDDDLMKSLHERFRGRARPVAMLADAIKSKHAQTADVVQIADEFESYSLDANEPLSLTASFLSRLNDTTSRLRIDAQVVATLVYRFMTMEEASVAFSDHVEFFEAGIAPLRTIDGKTVVSEPLALKAIIVALSNYDPNNKLMLNPHYRALELMADVKQVSSAIGFVAETALSGYIHNYIAHNIALPFADRTDLSQYPSPSLSTNAERPLIRHVFNAADCIGGRFSLCSPPLNAHPDVIHTLIYGTKVFGALGQIKFTQLSLEKADWEHAVRSTSKSALYRIDADPKQVRKVLIQRLAKS
jgi:hypothetical protein